MKALAKKNAVRMTEWQSTKPLFLQLQVDEIYQEKHELGDLWQLPVVEQLTPDQLAYILSNPLFTEVKTVEIVGNAPVLHPKLVDLVSVLCEKLPELSNIDLVTSVLDPARTIDCIVQVGKIVRSHAVNFLVKLAVHGLEEAFSAPPEHTIFHHPVLQPLLGVLEFIQTCEVVSEFKLESTITKESLYHLHLWLELAIAWKIPIVYNLGIPGQISEAVPAIASGTFEFKEKYHLAIFLENLLRYYETSEAQIQFYQSLVGQLIDGQHRAVDCKWQPGGVTLSGSGELLYCAIASKPLGSALEHNPTTLYETHQEHLHQILQTACNSCMQGCILTSAVEHASNVSQTTFRAVLRQFSLPNRIRSSKLLQPLKTFRLQAGFQKHLQTLGVDAGTETAPKVTFRFPDSCSSKRKVLICGWYGTETLGDKAILGGVVQALQEAMGEFELHLVAIEVYISQMTILQMPELQGCVLHSLTEGLEIVQSMDLVVFGGGPLMAIGAMAEMMAFFQRAGAANIPTLLAGCGVGPLGATFLNDAVKHVLMHSSYRIYRDQKSLENARSLGVDVVQDSVAEDPAFTWLADKTDRWKTANTHRLDNPRLILGLRDWPYHEFAAEMGSLQAERLKLRFEQEVAAGLEQLVEQYPNLKIIAFPMCTNPLGFDDRWFYHRLFRDQPKLKKFLDFSYLGAELSPEASISVFQSATAALTMRFHSLIFALSNGVPAIAVDYTLGRGKVKSLAEMYRVPYRGLDTISADFIVSSLSQILTGKSCESVTAFQQRKLTFKDSVKAVIESLKK